MPVAGQTSESSNARTRSAPAPRPMTAALAACVLLLCSALAAAQSQVPEKLSLGVIEIHYIEQGRGEPLILPHGGQGDYRSRPEHLEAFPARYRVISYSRRYHYPNVNPICSNHSALVDAEDPAALIRRLDLGSVRLVGTSYGALTALALAVSHPELLRTLVPAEPPVHRSAADSQGGAALYLGSRPRGNR